MGNKWQRASDDHVSNELTAGDIIGVIQRTREMYRSNAEHYPIRSPERTRIEARAAALSHMLDRITAHKMGIRQITND